MKRLLKWGFGSKKDKKIELLLKEINDRNDTINKLKKELENCNTTIGLLEKDVSDLYDKIKIDDISINEKNEVIRQFKKDKKELSLENNKQKEQIDLLTKEIEETKKKLEESMTDKFLVKKTPAGRKPRTQTMKVKSSNVTSKIIKQLKEK